MAWVAISADTLQAGDTLNFANQNGITGSYNSGTGTLALTGSATPAQYQTALQSITFSTTRPSRVRTRSNPRISIGPFGPVACPT